VSEIGEACSSHGIHFTFINNFTRKTGKEEIGNLKEDGIMILK
jgi:hypothetical protein